MRDFVKGFDFASNIIGTFSSLITMVIAFLLFDQFGLKQRFVNCQTDSVIRLIERLRNFNCIIKSKKVTYQIPFSADLSHRKNLIKQAGDDGKQLMFTGDPSYMNTISELINDFWIPSNIKNKAKFLESYGTFDITDDKTSSINKLIVLFGGKESDKVLLIGDQSVIEFIENIENLKSEISFWLQKHSSMKINKDFSIT
jgi:hypothetical protein